MNNAIVVQNLTKNYGDFVLDSLCFELPQGHIMGIIGENGAGKSTTINCILNEVKASSGTIQIFGKDHIAAEKEIKNEIGVIFDECTFPVYFTVKQLEQVMKHAYSNWDTATYYSYVRKFSLPEKKMIKDFSRGMKIKVAFAVALSHNAKLLILDEATSGLDPIIRDDILDILFEFIQNDTHSVLFSSHITDDLEKIADYITFIHAGKKIFTMPKDELLDNYGIVKCTDEQFGAVENGDYIIYQKQDYQYRLLVADRNKTEKKYPKLVVEPASIDDIMLLYVKGEIV
ncbi:ABC transporter ATP-binding protein [Roseburia hominis]